MNEIAGAINLIYLAIGLFTIIHSLK